MKVRRKQGLLNKVSLTTIFIAINVFVFVAVTIASLVINFTNPDNLQTFVNYIALTPELVARGWIWTLLTSMFTHFSFFHLFVNVLSLFFLGNLVESIIGRKRYWKLYLLSGLGGGLLYFIGAYIGLYVPHGNYIFGTTSTAAVGASGALFGLLGLLAVLIPFKEVYLISGPIIVIILQFALGPFLPEAYVGTFNIAMSLLIFVMLFSMFSPYSKLRKISVPLKLKFWLTPVVAIVPLVIVSFFVPLPIGNTAHLGGLIVGLVYGLYLRLSYPNKVAVLNQRLRLG